MPRPTKIIDSVETDAGKLELVRIGDDEWLITIERRPLMSSRLNRSEIALARLACQPLAHHPAPRVLTAGLGIGYTLRAALDVLPDTAEVVAAELNEIVVRWNRGPLAPLSRHALEDPRVQLKVADVGDLIADAAKASIEERYDAIVLDLYEGPYPPPAGTEDRVFGRAALLRASQALRDAGCLAVWSEGAVPSFEKRVRACGFRLEYHRPKYKGPRHVVYLAFPR